MRSLVLSLALFAAAPAFATEPCEIALRSADGHDVKIQYHIVGGPNRAGTFKVENFLVSVYGVPSQTPVRMELKEVFAHGQRQLDQLLLLNMLSPSVSGRDAHVIDGQLHTSANNHQELSIKVADSYLIDPVNGTTRFQINLGEHLWDGLCRK